ncbi:hypothetical protein QYF61_013992 [Mycteria americana]|uniref:P2X purinoreceptor 7 intracellular domain-containing protein n=1 Tax=Mycteria americana TaxID=33587 RepID=A0AAN7MWP6_MYCAM|nr:hypothetical protein QYF61_013992 [Mycteria americana]
MLGKILFIKLASAPSLKAERAGGRREKKLRLFLCSAASWRYIPQGSCTDPHLLFCRYARYYKLPHGKEQRTLFKAYRIRFDVLAFSTLDEAANAVFFNLCWELLLQSHPVKFCDAGSCCTSESNENHDNEESEPMHTSESNENHDNEESEQMHTSESNENHDNEEYELGQPLRQGSSSPDCQKWCCCGKCQPTQKYHEQLCCRRKKGQCITTSHWFQQLVLSSHALKKALLYKDPFVDLADGNINNQLCHLAYKQYVHWCFGTLDLEDRAIIPSCCRWKIRDTYPKAVNSYTGFKME